jgi:hypothetical protein
MAPYTVPIISSGSNKVMCTQCTGEVSVNKAFKLQQHTEYMVNNLLNLQKDMVELNFLLKSADRRTVKEIIVTS